MTGQGAGVWLREQRLARGWAKAELARRLRETVRLSGAKVPGVTSIIRSVYAWEAGGRYPQDRWRAMLCQVLDVALEDFPARPGPAACPAGLADLDRDDPRPWVRVARMLLERIEAGKLKAGDPAPRTAEIAGKAGVTVPTVRKAYQYLRAQQVLRYWPGAGYHVSSTQPDEAGVR